jgi:hypothetical protein
MEKFIKSEKGKMLYWIIGIITVILFAIVLIPSLFSYINRADIMFLNIPFSIFMYFVICMVLAFLLMFLYHIQNIRGEL